MSEFPAVIDLSSLNGSNGFKISSETLFIYTGYSVASAGDVNGDGFDDVIVGAPGDRFYNDRFDASYVVFGKARGFATDLNLSELNGTNGFQIDAEALDRNGLSVASAGDVNGDGFADVIVGAPEADPHGSQSGASYVVFGKASAFGANLDLSSLNGTNGFQINGEAAQDYSGFSVASAGDVNGDGFDDVIVGAGSADPHGISSGASYIVFGKASGFAANLDLSSLDGSNGFKINGEEIGDFSGGSVASAGDVNGDGFADVILGAKFANPNGSLSGASYVVFGKASDFAANLDLSSLNGSNGFQISGEVAFDLSGVSVASAGDVNGDGIADLIVGAFGADPHGDSSGASYVVFGTDQGFGANLDLSSLDGTNGFQISGEAADDRSGISVASAGDVNGDGFDDLIVGAKRADPHGSESGASYVVFGKAGGLGANINLSSLDGTNGFQINGELAFDNSGTSVAAAGDVNGDGFDDVIVGAPGLGDDYSTGASAAYVVFGRAPDAAVERSGTSADNVIQGGAFADRLKGLGGDDVLEGRGGADRFDGGNGLDTVSYAHASASVVADLATPATNTGEAAGDRYTAVENLEGSNFGDTLTGTGSSANRLDGLAGDDKLFGRGGTDTLLGGAGDDRLNGGADADALDGGAGSDTASYATATSGLVASLRAPADNTGEARGDSYISIENLEGTQFADTLVGSSGDNTIAGRGGNDKLTGAAGRDLLIGGADDDTFDFNVTTVTGTTPATRDVIADFGRGNDRIDLIDIDSDTIASGNQAFAFIGASAFSHTAGELRAFQQNGNTIVEGDVNGDGTRDFQIELTGLHTLNAGDFML